jgi:CheY-like chemotaxis protein
MAAQGGLPAPPDLSQICVMVVDPRPGSRAATVQLLRDTGYNVRVATESGRPDPSCPPPARANASHTLK